MTLRSLQSPVVEAVPTVHQTALDELIEWWEDVHDRDIGSRAVLLSVPSGWGRSAVLDLFERHVVGDLSRLGLAVRINCADLPSGAPLQAAALVEVFDATPLTDRAAEVLGVDRLAGIAQNALGVLGVLASWPTTALLLLGSLGVGVGERAGDRSTNGARGVVERLARRIARLSVPLAIVVILDDLDRLDTRIGIEFVRRLVERPDGHVLVVCTAPPDSDVAQQLVRHGLYDPLTERVFSVDVPPGMDEPARTRLVDELFADLPFAARERLVRRSQTFADILAVASAPGTQDLLHVEDEAILVDKMDRLFEVCVRAPIISICGLTCAWAGGALHEEQWDAARSVLDASPEEYGGTTRFGTALRIAEPLTDQLADRVNAVLDRRSRRLLASAIA